MVASFSQKLRALDLRLRFDVTGLFFGDQPPKMWLSSLFVRLDAALGPRLSARFPRSGPSTTAMQGLLPLEQANHSLLADG